MIKTVNVLMGGPSAEYEVSLRSGFEVLSNLDKLKYRVRVVVVSKSKKFYTCNTWDRMPSLTDIESHENSSVFSGPFAPSECPEMWKDCDVAFLALHGEFGEDGVIQGYLDALGVPYTGSGVFGSAVAMNKITTKYLYIQCGLDVPPYCLYGKNHPQTTIDAIISGIGFPCFVKCPQSGSSRLMGKADTKEQLESLLTEYQESADEILIENLVSGPEFTCGVIDYPDGTTRALPPVEIRPNNAAFFDYEAKYSDGGSEELVPAPRPDALLNRIQDAAIKAHRVIGCQCVSRTDMIYMNDKLHVLETNTLPGLTPASLLPKSFKAIGVNYQSMLDILIESALNKRNIFK
ncbi:MAG: D-alanine--D-alanine ligase [Fibrobacter sp.]|nr:D-alanine--D-alanine ligase [Fibrobacter sp.]